MNLFCSYAHADRNYAEKTAHTLTRLGHQLWIDDELLGGLSWQEQLRDAITRADGLVCLLSPAYVASEWCMWELITAVEMQKPVLPLLIESVALPTVIANLQYIDLTAGVSDTIEQKIALSLQHISRPDPIGVRPNPPPQTGTPSRVQPQPIAMHIGLVQGGGQVIGNQTIETQQNFYQSNRLVIGLILVVLLSVGALGIAWATGIIDRPAIIPNTPTPAPTPFEGTPFGWGEVGVVIADFTMIDDIGVDVAENLRVLFEDNGITPHPIRVHYPLRDYEAARTVADQYNATLTLFGNVTRGRISVDFLITPRQTLNVATQADTLGIDIIDLQEFSVELAQSGQGTLYLYHFTIGQIEEANGNLESALVAYSQALSLVPVSEQNEPHLRHLYRSRSSVYTSMGETDAAYNDITRALELYDQNRNYSPMENAQWALMFAMRGTYSMRVSNSPQAEMDFSYAFRLIDTLDPEDPYVAQVRIFVVRLKVIQLALAAFFNPNDGQALTEAIQLVQTDLANAVDDVVFNTTLAGLYFQRGDIEDAIAHCEAAISVAQDEGDELELLGAYSGCLQIYQELDPDRAMEIAQAGLELEAVDDTPQEVSFQAALAFAYGQSTNVEAWTDLCEPLAGEAATSVDRGLYINCAQSSANVGQAQLGTELLGHAIDTFGDPVSLPEVRQIELADMYRMRWRLWTALEMWDASIEDSTQVINLLEANGNTFPWIVGAHLNRASARMSGSPEARELALTDIEQAQQILDQYPDPMLQSALDLWRVNYGVIVTPLEQRAVYERIIELIESATPALLRQWRLYGIDPQWILGSSYVGRSESLLATCEAESAEESLRLAWNAGVPFEVFGFNLARVYLQAGRYEEARTVLDGLIERQPGNPFAIMLRVPVLVALDNLEDAYKDAQTAIEILPANEYAWRVLALSESLRGDLSSAEEAAEEALRLYTFDDNVFLTYAAVALMQQNESAAYQAYQQFLTLPSRTVIQIDTPLTGLQKVSIPSLTVQQYRLIARAGETITITARGVDEAGVDTLILVEDTTGTPVAGSDDTLLFSFDADDWAAVVEFEAPESGEYRVLITHHGCFAERDVEIITERRDA